MNFLQSFSFLNTFLNTRTKWSSWLNYLNFLFQCKLFNIRFGVLGGISLIKNNWNKKPTEKKLKNGWKKAKQYKYFLKILKNESFFFKYPSKKTYLFQLWLKRWNETAKNGKKKFAGKLAKMLNNEKNTFRI